MNNFPKVPKPPLSKVVMNEPILNLDASVNRYLKKYYKKEMWAGFVFIGLWELITAFFVIRHLINVGSLSEDAGKGIIFLVALPVLAAFGILGVLKKRLLHQFYQQFAEANGFSYQKSGWLEGRLGAIFKVGHSAKMEDIVQGELNGLPLNFFNYQYTVGSGKSSRTFLKTVLEVDLKTLAPPMLLLVDWHTFGDNISDNNLNNVSKIDLGGDLEKHFNLFAEKKFELEALQIFTPEFLNLIYEKYKQFSLDFCGSKLYVYASGVIANKMELDLMLEFVQTIAEKAGTKLPNMQSSIMAMHEALTKTPQSGLSFFKTATNLTSSPVLMPVLVTVFGLGIAILASVLMSMF